MLLVCTKGKKKIERERLILTIFQYNHFGIEQHEKKRILPVQNGERVRGNERERETEREIQTKYGREDKVSQLRSRVV